MVMISPHLTVLQVPHEPLFLEGNGVFANLHMAPRHSGSSIGRTASYIILILILILILYYYIIILITIVLIVIYDDCTYYMLTCMGRAL